MKNYVFHHPDKSSVYTTNFMLFSITQAILNDEYLKLLLKSIDLKRTASPGVITGIKLFGIEITISCNSRQQS